MREEIVIAWGRIGHHIRPALPLENAVAAGTGLKEVDDISPPAGNWNRRSTLTPGPSSLSKGVAMIISTMNDLPGYRIDEVLGEVFGLTVRSRNVGSQIGASAKSLVGGTTPTSS